MYFVANIFSKYKYFLVSVQKKCLNQSLSYFTYNLFNLEILNLLGISICTGQLSKTTKISDNSKLMFLCCVRSTWSMPVPIYTLEFIVIVINAIEINKRNIFMLE